MSDTLPINTNARPGTGDNNPPLWEILTEELAADRARADEFLAEANYARIENAADAGKIADLIVLISDQEKALDQSRNARKKPLLHDQRIIEAAFGAVIGPLARARTDKLQPLFDRWCAEHPDEPLAPSIAAVGSRRTIDWVIEDLPVVIGWLLIEHPGPLIQACRTIVSSLVRSAGVDAVERGEIAIPGISISVMTKTQIR
jgi:hypothetical protein